MIGDGVFELIDDSYNASPVSLEAAHEVLAAAPTRHTGKRIAPSGNRFKPLFDFFNQIHKVLLDWYGLGYWNLLGFSHESFGRGQQLFGFFNKTGGCLG